MRHHLHQSTGPLIIALGEVEDTLDLYPPGDDVLVVADALLLAPAVVGGSRPAHHYLGVVGHQRQH